MFMTSLLRQSWLTCTALICLCVVLCNRLNAQTTFSWDFSPCDSQVLEMIPANEGWVGCQRITCESSFSAHLFRIAGDEVVDEQTLEGFNPMLFFSSADGFIFLNRTPEAAIEIVHVNQEFEVQTVVDSPLSDAAQVHVYNAFSESGQLYAVYHQNADNTTRVAHFTHGGVALGEVVFEYSAPILPKAFTSIALQDDGAIVSAIDCAHYIRVNTEDLSTSELLLPEVGCLFPSYIVYSENHGFFAELAQFQLSDNPSPYSGFTLAYRDPNDFQITDVVELHEEGVHQSPTDVLELEDGSLLFSVITQNASGDNSFRFLRTDLSANVLVQNDYSSSGNDFMAHAISRSGDAFAFYGFIREVALGEQYHANVLVYPKNEILVDVATHSSSSHLYLEVLNGELHLRGANDGLCDFEFYNTLGQMVHQVTRGKLRCTLPKLHGGIYIVRARYGGLSVTTKLFLQ